MESIDELAIMPEYISRKRVRALRIASVGVAEGAGLTEHMVVSVTFDDTTIPALTVSCLHRPVPEPGWYYVRYEDGYRSFSPPDVFEKSCTPVAQFAPAPEPPPVPEPSPEPEFSPQDFTSFGSGEMESWFSYHPPTPAKLVQYREIRAAARVFAGAVNYHVPASADKTAAIRKIREAAMTANAAITCHYDPI